MSTTTLVASAAAGVVSIEDDRGGRVTFGPDPFDSDALGLQIGRVLSLSAASLADRHALLVRMADHATRDQYQQILCRTNLDTLADVWALERAGFELMDAGITFARAIADPIDPPSWPDLTVRPSTDGDVAAIVSGMVGDPWNSRYEADPAYDPARVRELRTRWLWNSHRGRADVMLVGIVDGRPAGYATCRLDAATGHGEIELVGTLPAFRGRRVAARVIAHALSWLSTRSVLVTVRTQATNVAAAGLYERAGFTLRSSDLTYRLTLGLSGRNPL
jgi:ribosomal protein S18 acetylase RimI-like enzyme